MICAEKEISRGISWEIDSKARLVDDPFLVDQAKTGYRDIQEPRGEARDPVEAFLGARVQDAQSIQSAAKRWLSFGGRLAAGMGRESIERC